jgi:hypothetical protein
MSNRAALGILAPVIAEDAEIFQLGPSLELGHALLKVLELFKYGNAVTQKRLIERAEDLGATNC